MNWVWENRTWLFSGAGVSALVGLIWIARRLFFAASEETQLSNLGSHVEKVHENFTRPTPLEMFDRLSTLSPYEVTPELPKRIFVRETITPAYLTSFRKEHLSKDADKLLGPYLGKWIRVSCIVRNVYHDESNDNQHRYAVLAEWNHGKSTAGLHVYFEERWGERIMMLRRNDKIAIVGKISGSPAMGLLNLENCELES